MGAGVASFIKVLMDNVLDSYSNRGNNDRPNTGARYIAIGVLLFCLMLNILLQWEIAF